MIARKLLIAEDEPDLAEALQSFFEKNQFTVDTVAPTLTPTPSPAAMTH